MIKFIHCADLHLGGPVSTPDTGFSRRLHGELRRVFGAICTAAEERGAELVLISGDLFDKPYVQNDILNCVSSCFASHAGINFVISPGNHDHAAADSIYRKFSFPENVHIFKEAEPGKFSFGDVDVYGYAFTSPSLESFPFTGVCPEDPDRINILCCHGALGDPFSVYCPISQTDIEQSGFDYIALGHDHTNDGIKKLGATYYGYCGTPLGHDFGECGVRGVYYCELSKEGGRCFAKTEKLVLSPMRFESEELDVSGCTDNESVSARVREYIAAGEYDDSTVLRLKLRGQIPRELTLAPDYISAAAAGGVCLELRDATSPLYDAAELGADPTIRGAFFKRLLPVLESGTSYERECAALALKYGLTVLDGENIADE